MQQSRNYIKCVKFVFVSRGETRGRAAVSIPPPPLNYLGGGAFVCSLKLSRKYCKFSNKTSGRKTKRIRERVKETNTEEWSVEGVDQLRRRL